MTLDSGYKLKCLPSKQSLRSWCLTHVRLRARVDTRLRYIYVYQSMIKYAAVLQQYPRDRLHLPQGCDMSAHLNFKAGPSDQSANP